MSVRIRLRRMGKKKQPHYRIVATDSRFPRDGRFVEILGHYNPVPDPARLSVDLERVDYWVGRGAGVSPTLRSLVSKARAGGDDKVAMAVPAAATEAEAGAAAGNGAAVEAPEAAAEGVGAADTEPAAEGDPAADMPEAATPGGDAEAGAGATEDGDAADSATAPASGSA